MSKVSPAGKAVSTTTLAKYKIEGRKIVCLTAYDYSTAKILDKSGVDVILVGDSLAMVALGHKTTHAVTVDEMLHHTKAVTRAVERGDGDSRPTIHELSGRCYSSCPQTPDVLSKKLKRRPSNWKAQLSLLSKL